MTTLCIETIGNTNMPELYIFFKNAKNKQSYFLEDVNLISSRNLLKQFYYIFTPLSSLNLYPINKTKEHYFPPKTNTNTIYNIHICFSQTKS